MVKELHKYRNLRSMFTGLSGDGINLSEIKEALVTQFKQDGLEHPHDRGSVLIENHGLHKLAYRSVECLWVVPLLVRPLAHLCLDQTWIIRMSVPRGAGAGAGGGL